MKKDLTGKIKKVSGPLVVAEGMSGVKMYDVVRVGEMGLVGEVIELTGKEASIQVYEETSGLRPGDPVESTGKPLTVTLGPGIMNSIYDGIQRPLDVIKNQSGAFIARGVEAPALDLEKDWDFNPSVQTGDVLLAGDVVGTVRETESIEHKVLIPPTLTGKLEVINVSDGKKKVTDVVATVKDEASKEHSIKLAQEWPIRRPRPVKRKAVPNLPLVTGQRVIDMFFPIAKGGAGAIPGPFGSGKSVTQQQVAKWADADVIVYIGCGERGNEMTDVLMEFPELTDPRTGKPLMQRTVLIANTSNMPVAAREASIYTGITIAEYYRDMGYDVALMADSTSRWAEALREISGRLEEMPGDEGYPAYLGSRTAEFYERAGMAELLGSGERMGSLTAIGAVSPPGGDLSEPVTQNTLRVVKTFWGLDEKLAYSRHYPAVNWLTSYTLYFDQLESYFAETAGEDWGKLRETAMNILQEEAALEEVVRLVGLEALSAEEQITMQIAKSLREDFLQQNAFDEIDTYTSLNKQIRLLRAIISIYEQAQTEAKQGDFNMKAFLELSVWTDIAQSRLKKEEEIDEVFDQIDAAVTEQVSSLVSSNS